tara:strand:- start:310 stop:1548 length:1239 start_codon:yes stop_codon:yes gene_type:complete
MSWAPKNSSIPPTQNINNELDTFCTVAAAASRLQNNEMLKADDLTVMIPYGSDSTTRVHNFARCIMNLLWNSTAKISVYWSETEEGLGNFVGWHPTSMTPLVEFFEKHDSSTYLRDVSKQEMKIQSVAAPGTFITKSLVQILADICVHKPLDCFQLPNSVTYGELLEKATGRKHSEQEPLRLNLLTEAVEKQLSERLTVYVELRKKGEPFHRMRYLNKLLSVVKTELVCNHDADVMIPSSALSDSISRLRNYTTVDVVYPYSATKESQIKFFHGRDTDARIIKSALTGDFSPLLCGGNYYLSESMYGLSFFARTDSYKKAYGENENFVSWGPEDVERYYRFCKLGLRVSRVVDGYVVHLEHERGVDSGNPNPHLESNNVLWQQLQSLTPAQLQEYYRGLEYPEAYGFLSSNS